MRGLSRRQPVQTLGFVGLLLALMLLSGWLSRVL